MLSKLTNGLAGTWDSLDAAERLLLIYGVVLAAFVVAGVAMAPAKRERKRNEMRELADMIAEKLGG